MREQAMQTEQTQDIQGQTQRTPRKLTLERETLRRLTPAALRLAAGGTILVAEPDPVTRPPNCPAGFPTSLLRS